MIDSSHSKLELVCVRIVAPRVDFAVPDLERPNGRNSNVLGREDVRPRGHHNRATGGDIQSYREMSWIDGELRKVPPVILLELRLTDQHLTLVA